MTIIGTLPNIIQNGQVEDATPLMADFNFIVSQVNANGLPTWADASLIGFDSTNLAFQITNRINRVVDNVAAISLLDVTKYVRVFATGYYAAGDGGDGGGLGGGFYYYNAASVATVDGGSVLAAAGGTGRWLLENLLRLNPFQFGAKGDKSTDDTVAIQNCYNAVTLGGTMYIPRAPGNAFIVSKQGANTYCLNFSRFVNIQSDGFYASLQPAAGTTVDTVYLQPNPAVAYYGMLWEGLSLGDPNTGTRQGRHGIFIDTQVASSQLPKPVFRRLNIGTGSVAGGNAINHLNNGTNNVNGGMYGATIENCGMLKGGVSLNASGDSITLHKNIISGPNVGAYVNLVSGASEFTAVDNNITSTGGSFQIDAGPRFRIINNNCEQVVATTGQTSMINLSAAGGTLTNGVIQGNHLGAFTGSNMTANINVTANAIGTVIESNTMLNANVGFTGPGVTDAGTQTRVGFNQYGANFTSFITPGAGCMGVARALPLQNGWVTFNAGKAPYVYKDGYGTVHVVGIIASGTITPNTVQFTLPDANYYPSQLLRFAVASNNGSVAVHGELQIDTSGNGTIQAGASPYFSITVSFPAANAGNFLSNS